MAGTPVVARRCCLAFADLVENGVNGILADDVAEVGAAVSQYLRSAELCQRHADQGRALAQSYTWRALADSLAGVIERVIRA